MNMELTSAKDKEMLSFLKLHTYDWQEIFLNTNISVYSRVLVINEINNLAKVFLERPTLIIWKSKKNFNLDHIENQDNIYGIVTNNIEDKRILNLANLLFIDIYLTNKQKCPKLKEMYHFINKFGHLYLLVRKDIPLIIGGDIDDYFHSYIPGKKQIKSSMSAL